MSEPTTLATPAPTTPAATPSGDINQPNTVIHPPETPIAPPVAVTPEIPSDYRVNTLENGQREVVLNTGQVYRGDTDTLINELAKAQYNASKRITELGQQIPQHIEPEPVVNGIDPTAKALADLAAQGMGYQNADELTSAMNMMQQSYVQQQLNAVAAQFLATTPDFPKSPENADKLDQTLNSFGLQPTPEALTMVHNHLKATGQYVAVPNAPITQPRAPGMPMPPNGITNQPSGSQDPWAMPFAELEAAIRAGKM